MRQEVTANTCFGTAAHVRAHVDAFFASLATRREEVRRRCRTALQTRADALYAVTTATDVLAHARHHRPSNALPRVASV